jgi:hypothetical protein
VPAHFGGFSSQTSADFSIKIKGFGAVALKAAALNFDKHL